MFFNKARQKLYIFETKSRPQIEHRKMVPKSGPPYRKGPISGPKKWARKLDPILNIFWNLNPKCRKILVSYIRGFRIKFWHSEP